ncbi:MAG: gas vesicle protein K [Geobacteraceae bacterium]|nr:gas vesicle protein K [Geobacteraceae bacterium]
MNIDIEQDNLKQGVLGLVLALVEIIRDLLKTQAVRRMEGGSLNGEEIERLGKSLMEFDRVVEQIKEENGVTEAVRSVRESLDSLVEKVLGGGADGR